MLNASHKIFLHKLKWYVFEKVSFFFDFILYYFHIYKSIKKTNKKLIVFIGEMLPPRIPRLAKWIKRSGDFHTILLCSKKGFFSMFCNNDFDAVFLFRNEWHLKRILKSLTNIYILHGFAPKSFYPDIARKFVKAPYIHDMQDVFSLYYGTNPSIKWLQKELPHEKNCLQYADGIIGQSLEPNIGIREYKIKRKKCNLYFGLYCDDDFIQNNNKHLSQNDIHIVYAGGVAGSHRDNKQYGNIQFHNLIKTLTEQKIHFHIYPSPSNIKADYEEYFVTAKQNNYFHFHEPISQNEIAAELSKYHFGILPFFKELSEQSPLKLKYATTLKLFNYLEAGLPVIVSSDLGYQSWLISRYKCGIVVLLKEINQLRRIFNSINYTDMITQVQITALKLSMSQNIKRIVLFYKTLQNK